MHADTIEKKPEIDETKIKDSIDDALKKAARNAGGHRKPKGPEKKRCAICDQMVSKPCLIDDTV